MRNGRRMPGPSTAALLLVGALLFAATTGSATVFADQTPSTTPEPVTVPTSTTVAPDPGTPDPATPAPTTTTPASPPPTTITTPVDPATTSTVADPTTSSTVPTDSTTSPQQAPPSQSATTSRPKSPSARAGSAHNPLLVGLPVDVSTPAVEHQAPAGPPDVSTPLMPSDSVTGAVEELDALRSIAAQLVAARSTLISMATTADTTFVATSAALADGRRAQEAVRADAADRVLGIVLHGGSQASSSLDARRSTKLTQTVEEALDRRITELDRTLGQATEARAVIARAMTANVQGGTATEAEIVTVTAKLMTVSRLGVAGPVAFAAPGPTEIAGRAADASSALAAGRDGGPEQQLLAASIAAQTGVAARALVASWAVTPIPARRATFFALSQVGKAYVYATDGPDQYDCSGLTERAWAESGVGLPHFSGAQLHAGIPVTPSQLRPGDLLTYGPDGADHVTMYVGAGLVVEAKGRQWGVVVSHADVDASSGRFAGASRPVP
jgi:peptidoglycan DL-endopeptidase CwlO